MNACTRAEKDSAVMLDDSGMRAEDEEATEAGEGVGAEAGAEGRDSWGMPPTLLR